MKNGITNYILDNTYACKKASRPPPAPGPAPSPSAAPDDGSGFCAPAMALLIKLESL